ncbi:hypothetical protein BU16DRAFT_547281 [Lophium mytilinum]|uniref:Cyclin-D1-binding protein 1-like N-terminal domain-containing protein n=1 Tax=Lophium mytilinum TaxID=390894 RepID=A0A6A6R9E7_9PEZI|nr:hypothetical protein BU16DRAFT_547281 [Lophium mytilinum]
MPPKTTPTTAASLIDLTHTTRTLLTHLQSSLTTPNATSTSTTPSQDATTSETTPPPILETLKSTTALLRANTTTLSLLLLTPPLTPSALYPKITTTTDILLTMVACLTPTPTSTEELGDTVHSAARLAVRRVLNAWSELLALVGRVAERVQHGTTDATDRKSGKVDKGVAEADRAAVLAATGVVWECCEAVEVVVADGVVGTVVRKAQEWRGVLVDAVNELKEWGEEEDDDEEEEGVGSDGDEDDLFGAGNKLGKGDSEMRRLLERSVKKLRMVGVVYQALVKRRLRTFPVTAPTSASKASKEGEVEVVEKSNMQTLDQLMALLKGIPETVDELASAFYDLDAEEAGKLLEKVCGDAVKAIQIVEKSWDGKEDEFSAWAGKWRGNFEGVE